MLKVPVFLFTMQVQQILTELKPPEPIAKQISSEDKQFQQ
jgi:hypothetical protein